jgi:hypothetical protein
MSGQSACSLWPSPASRALDPSPVQDSGARRSQTLNSRLAWAVLFPVFLVLGLISAQAAAFDDEDEIVDLAKLPPDALTRRTCTICHQYPEPSLLTKKNWREQILPRMSVELGIFPPDYGSSPEGELLRARRIYPDEPRIPKDLWPKIEKYYLETAPDEPLPQPPHTPIGLDLKLFQLQPPRFRHNPPTTTLVKISPDTHRIYVGDDFSKSLYILDATGQLVDTIDLANVPVDVVESERGIYVTCIGSFMPSEYYRAEFKFLERKGDHFGPPQTLLKGLPRTVQARFADFNGDGREDFVLCMYGNRTGRFSWFENRGEGKYEEHILLDKSGAMYCHVRDFNGDTKPDLAVLVAQESEMLIIYLNDGKGEFIGNILFQKPPVFGHSWFEPVDFNKDGRLDFVVVNGDNGEYDSPTKNYHGIRILLNEGELNYREAFFYPLNGAYKALARDFDGDGDLDIAAISFFPDYVNSPRESFVYLENKGDFKFKVDTFPQCISGRWLVMDANDLDGDGDLDIVLGCHIAGPKAVPKFLLDLWNKQQAPVLVLRNRLREPQRSP